MEAMSVGGAHSARQKAWQVVLRPGVHLLNRLSTAGKFGLLGLLVCLPLVWLSTLQWRDQAAAMQRVRLLDVQASSLDAVMKLQELCLRSALLDGETAARARQQADGLLRQWAVIGEDGEHVQQALKQVIERLNAPAGDDIQARYAALQALGFAVEDTFSIGSSVSHDSSRLTAVAFEILPDMQRRALMKLAGRDPARLGAEQARHEAHLGRIQDEETRRQLEMKSVVAVLREGLPDGAAAQRVLVEVDRAKQAIGTRLASSVLQMERAQQSSVWLNIGLLVGSLVLVFYCAGALVLSLRARLGSIGRMVDAMEHADFSSRLKVDGHDEVATMLQSMNGSFDRLTDLLRVVQQGASAVQFATEQLASGNVDLSERNRRTTQGLQEVIDAVARYATQLQACGREVESVTNTVQMLRMDSANTRKQMVRLQERMNALREHSQEIGQIVSLIDAIAFRTNVLALNASIEASKAGEAGRGFAVVAQEVRSLAMRSADSSRKINDIVRRSTEDIDLGAAMAEETGRVIAAADVHVGAIHKAIVDVAHLTREGETESAAILGEIKALTEVTDRNTALVEQLALASRSLHTQGATLTDKVNQFRLG